MKHSKYLAILLIGFATSVFAAYQELGYSAFIKLTQQANNNLHQLQEQAQPFTYRQKTYILSKAEKTNKRHPDFIKRVFSNNHYLIIMEANKASGEVNQAIYQKKPNGFLLLSTIRPIFYTELLPFEIEDQINEPSKNPPFRIIHWQQTIKKDQQSLWLYEFQAGSVWFQYIFDAKSGLLKEMHQKTYFNSKPGELLNGQGAYDLYRKLVTDDMTIHNHNYLNDAQIEQMVNKIHSNSGLTVHHWSAIIPIVWLLIINVLWVWLVTRHCPLITINARVILFVILIVWDVFLFILINQLLSGFYSMLLYLPVNWLAPVFSQIGVEILISSQHAYPWYAGLISTSIAASTHILLSGILIYPWLRIYCKHWFMAKG